MHKVALGIGALLAAASAAIADEPRDIRRVEQALQAVIARAEPAVACLYVYRPDHADSFRAPTAAEGVPDYYASGVVVESGRILTNYHFIREAAGEGDPTHVRFRTRLPARKDAAGNDGAPRQAIATLFAADAKSDLAVLRYDEPRGRTPTIPLGRGEDLKKGSFVVSLAHPYAAGYRDGSPSASTGIVSNLRRRQVTNGSETDRAKLPLRHFATLVQTDVRLQLGTSGGALLDLDGKLVGLTTAAAALTGVDAPGGFAIPMDEAMRRIVEVLVRGDEVEYGFLGINTNQDPDRRLPPGEGVMISRVVGNTPAADFLRPGDVILKINGRTLGEYDDLFLQLATTLAGRKAALLIRRGPVERTVDVPLVKVPVEVDRTTHRLKDEFAVIAMNKPRDFYGLRVDYTSLLAKETMSLPPGVLVREA
ncbi:MAG TPA: S1C family serine protease, partial [Gemmataceae bacterium]|nr:S1C family serine protease [Gemmataceae bacterium]